MHSGQAVRPGSLSEITLFDISLSTLPKSVQKVLFSATFPEHVTTYADRFAPQANQITLQHQELTVEGIRQLYFECDGEKGKIETLLKLYGLMTVGSSIIFVNVCLPHLQRRSAADSS